MFKCVSFILVPVVRVIHTLRNFVFKNQSKRLGKFGSFLGVLLREFGSR